MTTSARAILLRYTSEQNFEDWVVRQAERHGFCGFHVRHSVASVRGVHRLGRLTNDHSDAFGWPDWQFYRAGGPILYRELKSDDGVLSVYQKQCHERLRMAGADVAVWRPSDEQLILDTFRRTEQEMPWARLDDRFHDHPKIVGLPHAAVGVYALGLSYAASQLTDGVLPKRVVAGWRDATAVRKLVDAGLWESAPGGYRIHDYLDWNPSRDQVIADRAKAAERKRKRGDVRPESGRTPVRPDSGRTPVRGTSGDPLHSTLSTEGINAAAAGEAPARARARGPDDAGFKPLGAFLTGPPGRRQRQRQQEIPDEVRERLQRPPITSHAAG